MSDPSVLPDVTDVAKVGGGGAVASLLTVLAGRLFGSQDKVIARLDALQAMVMDSGTKLAVLVSASERRDADVEKLQAVVEAQGQRLARLEAVLEQLSEGGIAR